MNICLKTYAKQSGPHHLEVQLKDRLPERMTSPCEVSCEFHVVNNSNYYLLTLDIAATLSMECQRCLHAFQVNYCNQSKLAVCYNDAIAESLMEDFECIVAPDLHVDLVAVLTDELHLFSPEKHPSLSDCHSEMSQWNEG